MQGGRPCLRAQVFQGLILASRDRFMREAPTGGLPGGGAYGGSVTDAAGYLAALWAHECARVFCDKMITSGDKAWVEGAIVDLARCGAAPACHLPYRKPRWLILRYHNAQSAPYARHEGRKPCWRTMALAGLQLARAWWPASLSRGP